MTRPSGHEVTIHGRPDSLTRATCTCRWDAAGPFDEVRNAALWHSVFTRSSQHFRWAA